MEAVAISSAIKLRDDLRGISNRKFIKNPCLQMSSHKPDDSAFDCYDDQGDKTGVKKSTNNKKIIGGLK
ncbi:hypothetical protein ACI0FM_08955 [Paenochrobactrum sp. BZR 588]|uniref:hypothetical protein n=1 Tax=Paenochrobactrum sp. BZR 588 TaxID=3378076 RepID=UPI0038541974